MKILLDNNVPVYVLRALTGHEASTAYRKGWHLLTNGNLLDAAEADGFELLLTLDTGMRSQQNMTGRQISVAILMPTGQARSALFAVTERFLSLLPGIQPGSVVLVPAPDPSVGG